MTGATIAKPQKDAMSAVNASSPSASRQEEVRAHEPSMEEILASIRRIIADDEPPAARKDERRRLRDEPEHVSDAAATQETVVAPILERREPFLSTPERVEAAPVAEIRSLRLTPRELEPEPVVDSAEDEDVEDSFDESEELFEVAQAAPEAQAPLMSSDAASAIAGHFETLAATMLINDSGILRDYAQEMMRPMLKQWLDDNLPVIVERLVRAEIERVARGGRR